MSRAIPSPQTLRHLRHLCMAESSVATRPLHIRTRQSPLRCPINSSWHTSQRGFGTTFALNQEAQSAPDTQTPPPQPSHTATDTNPSSGPATTPPDISTYYTLFPQTLPSGPPPSSPFPIVLPRLRREFLALQSKYHPDKYPPGTPSHTKSLALSSLLNTAYKTLSDPLLRARYLLLENYGIDVTSEDNSLHAGVTDQATLLEVMDAQEALEEARSHEEIEKLMEGNSARIKETEAVLGKAFADEDVESAKRECVRLNYWRSLHQALREWEPGKEVKLVH